MKLWSSEAVKTVHLSRLHIELSDGQPLTLYSEDLEVDGVVQYSDEERLWVALINWDAVHEIEEVDASPSLIANRLQTKTLPYILESLS